MSLIVTSLASGSSGNAFLVQAGRDVLLIEAGISVRAIERHLRDRGVDPASLAAIVVSHEHHDHAQSAGRLARRYRKPIVCSEGTAKAMTAEWKDIEIRKLDAAGLSIGEVDLWGFALPHDAAEPLGFLLAYDGQTMGMATDLGEVPPYLPEYMAEADLVIIECNHDQGLMPLSNYPWPLQQRILGNRGHLDNLEAAKLLGQIGQDGRSRTVWLAHLSERANYRPQGVLDYVHNYLDMAGVDCFRLQVARRDRPSVTWPPLQQSIFDDF
jgi:phosphoribosyl 1,2-cyclic phosphodiesterase